jgi:hypothetical protein
MPGLHGTTLTLTQQRAFTIPSTTASITWLLESDPILGDSATLLDISVPTTGFDLSFDSFGLPAHAMIKNVTFSLDYTFLRVGGSETKEVTPIRTPEECAAAGVPCPVNASEAPFRTGGWELLGFLMSPSEFLGCNLNSFSFGSIPCEFTAGRYDYLGMDIADGAAVNFSALVNFLLDNPDSFEFPLYGSNSRTIITQTDIWQAYGVGTLAVDYSTHMPEPSTALLAGAALGLAAFLRRK